MVACQLLLFIKVETVYFCNGIRVFTLIRSDHITNGQRIKGSVFGNAALEFSGKVSSCRGEQSNRRKKWMNKKTEVWMNTQYPWKTGTCNRILSQLHALGVRFIDPIVANSTGHIQILYPHISFNQNNTAPRNNINNASVLYQICLAGKSMLFTGDLETEGWNTVVQCYPKLRDTTYYCISHHGSINGDIRTNCLKSYSITSLS